uniref:Uncharacterized protein n=1 Tax=Chromera velia CCMP2878 TaxID=1169474 RepID=A0A0G4I757_9ALVE|eukprot:Cvel_11605.t1-p1 / transcript=Cvel_11605.t1 / gene=Cvel_11605 / organism=Chromera_velia_CCMP2878 / gene_product=hypothetical protein / transcript_product=hypothetical protein / location=Cvel_scaffold734:56545-66028(+) / protein_length=495 / sequence_SO=supercontig / SO=protein_coding / is_pseudo=false
MGMHRILVGDENDDLFDVDKPVVTDDVNVKIKELGIKHEENQVYDCDQVGNDYSWDKEPDPTQKKFALFQHELLCEEMRKGKSLVSHQLMEPERYPSREAGIYKKMPQLGGPQNEAKWQWGAETWDVMNFDHTKLNEFWDVPAGMEFIHEPKMHGRTQEYKDLVNDVEASNDAMNWWIDNMDSEPENWPNPFDKDFCPWHSRNHEVHSIHTTGFYRASGFNMTRMEEDAKNANKEWIRQGTFTQKDWELYKKGNMTFDLVKEELYRTNMKGAHFDTLGLRKGDIDWKDPYQAEQLTKARAISWLQGCRRVMKVNESDPDEVFNIDYKAAGLVPYDTLRAYVWCLGRDPDWKHQAAGLFAYYDYEAEKYKELLEKKKEEIEQEIEEEREENGDATFPSWAARNDSTPLMEILDDVIGYRAQYLTDEERDLDATDLDDASAGDFFEGDGEEEGGEGLPPEAIKALGGEETDEDEWLEDDEEQVEEDSESEEEFEEND